MEKWAVIWSVAKTEPQMEKGMRERRDMNLHREFLKKHGAVFWSAGWQRFYTREGAIGYLYIGGEGVKYKLKVEKIVKRQDVSKDDKRFIPECRNFDEWKNIPTWIKITEIKNLRESIDPSTIKKYGSKELLGKGDATRAASSLQSAVRIIDEGWE